MFKTLKVGGQLLFEQSSTKIAQLVPPGFHYLLACNNIPLPLRSLKHIFILGPKTEPAQITSGSQVRVLYQLADSLEREKDPQRATNLFENLNE